MSKKLTVHERKSYLESLLESTVNQLYLVMRARSSVRVGHTVLVEVEDIERCHEHQKEILEKLK